MAANSLAANLIGEAGEPARFRDVGLGLAILACALLVTLAVQADAFLNHDVAWFTWAASEMSSGAVLGRDMVEPNFPLAYLIYLPAVALSGLLGLSAAVKAWMITLIALSGAISSARLKLSLRAPFLIVFGLFCAFALPREFGQREHISLLLVLPYCIPATQGRSPSIIVGVMAGVGFAIKPHFLLALAIVEISRKPFRTEQLALIATGIAYALVILIFFRPFLFDMLPLTREVYWAFDRPQRFSDIASAAVITGVSLLAAHVAQDRTARALAWAGAGFLLAAFAQQRLYGYQLLPVWGLVSLSASLLLSNDRHLIRFVGIAVIGGVAYLIAPATFRWWQDSESRRVTIPRLVGAIDQHQSFSVLAVHPYPAFPTALYARARYVGLSNSHWFLPAVAQSNGASGAAVTEATRQFTTELSRRPDMVVVDTDWRRHTETDGDWDGLDYLLRDPAIRSQWSRYQLEARIGPYDLYVRQ